MVSGESGEQRSMVRGEEVGKVAGRAACVAVGKVGKNCLVVAVVAVASGLSVGLGCVLNSML